MKLAYVQFRSAALNGQVTYAVILPENFAPPHPVLLQLHGLNDDHTTWLNQTNLVRHVAAHHLMVVLPSGGTSFYLDLCSPEARLDVRRYETFLMRDLWQDVQRTFHVRPGRWAIGGLSMGGYGALRLGCKYPDRFASIWVHSGAFLAPDELPGEGQDRDVFAVVERYARSGRGDVTISFDCGTEDALIDHNRRMHAHLESLGMAHTYLEHPGAHSWTYWDVHVTEALAQHTRVLEAEQTTPAASLLNEAAQGI